MSTQVFTLPAALARRLRRRLVEPHEYSDGRGGTIKSESVRYEDTGEIETVDARVTIDLARLVESVGGRAFGSKRRRTTLAGGAIVIEAINAKVTKTEEG